MGGVRIGGSFVAVFQGLFGASHPENQRRGAVNSFSPGPLWVLGPGIRPDPGPEDLPPQDIFTVEGWFPVFPPDAAVTVMVLAAVMEAECLNNKQSVCCVCVCVFVSAAHCHI